jgi:uncharacterized protein YjbI with pentapeptide repeats
MANQEHLDALKQNIYTWFAWRNSHQAIQPDLSGATLSGAYLTLFDLSGANFSGADLSGATLHGANLSNVNLSFANLTKADLYKAFLHGANLSNVNLSFANLRGATLIRTNLNQANLSFADFREADLRGADLTKADLSQANLSDANLSFADLSHADLSGADLSWSNISDTKCDAAILTGCKIYGLSAWNVHLNQTTQTGLIITRGTEPAITVDNLKIAQFIYLLLNNSEIREVIDTITSKVVLILGRFTPERKIILDALRDELRKGNYSPVLFDFEKPSSRDFTETVRTLAHLSRFIIADLTEPSSIPQELQAIVPDLEVPVQPLLLEAKREYSMFVDFRKYNWVLPVYLYKDQASLIASLKNEIIEPAEKKARGLAIEKAKRLEKP